MLFSLLACEDTAWERVTRGEPLGFVLDDDQPAVEVHAAVSLLPEVDGRGPKVLTFGFALDAVLRQESEEGAGVRILIDSDEDEPVPQVVERFASPAGEIVERDRADLPCARPYEGCVRGWTFRFERYGEGPVEVDASWSAVAAGGPRTVDDVLPGTILALTVTP